MTEYDDPRRQRFEERRMLREQESRTSNRYTVDGSARSMRSGATGYDRYDRSNYARSGREGERERGRTYDRDGYGTRNGGAGASRRARDGQPDRRTRNAQADGRARGSRPDGRTSQRAADGRSSRRRDSGRVASSADARSGRARSERTRTARSSADQRVAEPRQSALDRFASSEVAQRMPSIPIARIAIVVVAVLVLVLGIRACVALSPIDVTVNGTPYELRGDKTLGKALEASGLPINPGDFISLNGNVINPDQGHPFTATINDETSSDPNRPIANGDAITFTDGEDIVEEYDAVEQPVPFGTTITGVGAIHKFTPGADGVKEVRTGKVSGETVEKQTVEPQNFTVNYYNPNVGADKVVAFTFDDGPSSNYTVEVLDILKQNDVKATFFVLGTEIEDGRQDILKRERDEGHQVCTHTYDHADPAGGADIGAMSPEGQVEEVEKGREVITKTLGEEASRVIRLPGGNMSEAVINNIHPYVDAEIGWNVDTLDWTTPGADAIYEAMTSAKPGEVVLCHDSGGDRSQTVEALRKAVPELKEKGYTFVTIDELLAYPEA